jgi:hypothetical protein
MSTPTLAGVPFKDANGLEALPLPGKWDDQVESLSDGTRYRSRTAYYRDDISLTGEFLTIDSGQTPRHRMKFFDALAASGRAVPLVYGDLSYQVEVRTFTPTFVSTDQVQFTMTLFVATAGSLPTAPAAPGYATTAGTTAAQAGSAVAKAHNISGAH